MCQFDNADQVMLLLHPKYAKKKEEEVPCNASIIARLLCTHVGASKFTFRCLKLEYTFSS